MAERNRTPRGFTLIEILVTISVIILLLALILPALRAVTTTGAQTASMSNMRQIGTWMRAYSSDNREFVLPSRFDYRDNSYAGNVRAGDVFGEDAHTGIWADILWTEYADRVIAEAQSELGHDYSNAAPDTEVLDLVPNLTSPFRSTADNTRNAPDGNGEPIHLVDGDGAHERGRPGYLAANDFFNARPDAPDSPDGEPTPPRGRWYTAAQIRAADRSMYLVDSFYGATIEPIEEPFDSTDEESIQVDFRYDGVCIMLFMDGSVRPESRWDDLEQLEGNRQVRVRDLTRR